MLLLLVSLCIGCVSTISAADTDINDNMINANQDVETDLTTVDENSEDLSIPQEEVIVEQTNNEKVAVDAAASSALLSIYDQFCKDLSENKGTVYLNGNIKISEPFVIKQKTVIDGKGHTIDAQHKTQIFKAQGSLTLKNLVLINGKAEMGGAVFIKGDLTVDNCVFRNNIATVSGGAIGITYGHLTVKNSVFEKNSVQSTKSSGYGGAIWILRGSSSITKTTFKSNTCISKSLKNHKQATKYKFSGGAISYSYGSKHSLTNCKFNSNKASNHGGSIFAYKCKSLTIKKCEFSKNKANYEDGGAISFTANKLTVLNSKFKNNLAYEDGGAIDSYSLTGKKIAITIKNCQFISNTAYKCGGAIWMGVKTSYDISNSKFTKNKASSAGALEAEDGSAKITKCTFTSNKAAKVTSWVVKTKSGARLSHSGGAILVKNKCKITKCTFKGNKATWGKVVKIEGGKVTAKGNKGYKAN